MAQPSRALASSVRRGASALSTPLCLGVWGVGGAAWLLSGAWWLPPMTLTTAVVISWARSGRGPGPRPGARGESDQRARACAELIQQIAAQVEHGSPAMRAALGDAIAPLAPMRRRIAQLCARQAEIESWLTSRPQEKVAEQIERLRGELERARPETLREKLARAIASRKKELASLEALRATAQGLGAELEQIRAVLETCCCRLLAFDPGEEPGLAHERIARQVDEVTLSLESLEEAFARTSPSETMPPR